MPVVHKLAELAVRHLGMRATGAEARLVRGRRLAPGLGLAFRLALRLPFGLPFGLRKLLVLWGLLLNIGFPLFQARHHCES